MKLDDCKWPIILAFYIVIVGNYAAKMSWVSILLAIGSALIVYSLTDSVMYAAGSALVALVALSLLSNATGMEGFSMMAVTPLDSSVAKDQAKVLASTYEGFNTQTPPSQISELLRNLSKNTNIEGYEDVKVEKNETPAPAPGKDEKESKASGSAESVKADMAAMAVPFKLGEIPSQVKNGPHIDAGSTLMQAIKGLNPDQINAMTKDTQQLIETQKSLMGMLGSMKPMLNDGKQLMETFEQMFG